jgi:hypothetical protein
MLLITTLGVIEVEAVREWPDRLKVRTQSRETLQGVLDGLSLYLDGNDSVISPTGRIEAVVSREAVSQWLGHEVREYVIYQNLTEELIAAGDLNTLEVLNRVNEERWRD